MDIAALSMAMAQNNIGSKVGVAVLDKAMETAESAGAQIVQMIDGAAMQRSVTPHIGGNIDISV
ncbi:MAG: putative motility protein [Lachnospiraceae bacterium]|nr:putative motility protein [Lachnospiraceae bacterium]